ncbi:MAG: YhcH/YjgK/YiaL family protein [Clostridia bacterium]|nr:YhcH/YjgK/YiaL family protein [Clostridia bacterium]
MIYDKMENLAKYAKLNKGFSDVLKFIAKNDLLALPLGKKKISSRVNYNRQEYIGKEIKDDKYESHIKYIDIQIVLKNKEKVFYSLDKSKFTEGNEKDCGFTSSKNANELILDNKSFMIFFPYELHKPGLKINDKKVQKIIFKVKA